MMGVKISYFSKLRVIKSDAERNKNSRKVSCAQETCIHFSLFLPKFESVQKKAVHKGLMIFLTFIEVLNLAPADLFLMLKAYYLAVKKGVAYFSCIV